MISRKTFFRLVFLLLVAGALWSAWYFTSFKSLVVNYKNVSEISVYKSAALDEGSQPDPIATLSSSGEEIKLRQGEYTLYYKGSAGYETRYKKVLVDQKGQSITIDPEYSEEELSSIQEKEFPAIKSVINSKYPTSSQYVINKGQAMDKGAWYITTLTYKGKDSFNNDTLRIILKKQSGNWVVATDPPSLTFDKYSYPDIPKYVLDAANDL